MVPPAGTRQPLAGGTTTTGAGAASLGSASPTQESGPDRAPSAQPANPQVAALPAGEEYGRQNRDARVILRAKAATRVLVQGADGTVFINRILRPGDSYRVPDKVGLTLTTPDGGAVALELDGQEMGAAGSEGQVTEALPLDPQAISDRHGGGNPG